MPVCDVGSHLLARVAFGATAYPLRTRSPVRRPPPLTSPGRHEQGDDELDHYVHEDAHAVMLPARLLVGSNASRAKTFVRAVNAHASRHQRTRPYTPRHNGKVERYQRILAEECLYAHAFYSEGERREAISVWVHHYNYCESWGGWSGTGWQGERRAASAPRPWLLQLFAPIGCVSMDMSGSGVGWPALARPTPMA